jgi:hypothetical protein
MSLAPAINRLFAERRALWRARGLSMRTSGILAGAGCDTIDDVARLGRLYSRPNCGTRSLTELAELAGWPAKPHTMVDVIGTVLGLAIADATEVREVAQDVALALRRAGFVLQVRS